MKAAGNATVFGLDENHAIINQKTGKLVCEGGTDLILDQRSGRYQITKIRDTGKDYVTDIYVEKVNKIDNT